MLPTVTLWPCPNCVTIGEHICRNEKRGSHFQPCHSKALQHHGGHLFNFERATGAAAYPKRPDDIADMGDIADELDAFRMMEPLDQMAGLVDVSTE